MFELLFQNIKSKVELNEEEKEACRKFFIPKKIRKKQYLVQEGDVGKYTAFVEKGILRSYHLDEKGGEHIIQFAPEGWWIADSYSFLTGEPSSYNIEALEDCELLLLTLQSYNNLLLEVPAMERFFRILMQNSLISLQRRLVCSMAATAEEKYIKLVENYPDIVQRVPQHMVASYLGIAPETLSRIRKNLSKVKTEV